MYGETVDGKGGIEGAEPVNVIDHAKQYWRSKRGVHYKAIEIIADCDIWRCSTKVSVETTVSTFLSRESSLS